MEHRAGPRARRRRRSGAPRRSAARLWQRVRAFMETRDLLILPTTSVPPFPVEQPYPTEINGKPLDNYIQWAFLTYGITLTGLPAISVPCGFTRERAARGPADRRAPAPGSGGAARGGRLRGRGALGRQDPARRRLTGAVTGLPRARLRAELGGARRSNPARADRRRVQLRGARPTAAAEAYGVGEQGPREPASARCGQASRRPYARADAALDHRYVARASVARAASPVRRVRIHSLRRPAPRRL